MITIDENNLTDSSLNVFDSDNMEEKFAIAREALKSGEIPEDLKNFLTSLNQEDKYDDEELLDEEDNEISEEDSSTDTSVVEDTDSSNSVSLDADVSVDDLNDIF